MLSYLAPADGGLPSEKGPKYQKDAERLGGCGLRKMRGGPGSYLRTLLHAKLVTDVLYVSVHGTLGDSKALRDLPVGQAMGDLQHDLGFTTGQSTWTLGPFHSRGSIPSERQSHGFI